jgi:hypothetical protein
MRKWTFALLLSVLATSLAGDLRAQELVEGGEVFSSGELPFDQGGGDYPWADPIIDDPGSAGISSLQSTPYWYLQANALLLKRELVNDRVLAIDDGAGLGTPALSSNSLQFGSYEPGVELTFGWQLDPVVAVEATYWGLQSFNTAAQVSGNNNLSLPGLASIGTSDFGFADIVNADLDFETHNAEFNYKQTMYGLTMLAGFRYMNMFEELNLNFDDLDSGRSDFRLGTNNNLFGAQIGIGHHGEWNRLSWDILGKVGVFGNQASARNNMADINNSLILRDVKASSTRGAFIGELGTSLNYQVTNWFVLRGGYRVIWTDGIVMTTQNADFGDNNFAGREILDRSSLILHGFHGGAEFRW